MSTLVYANTCEYKHSSLQTPVYAINRIYCTHSCMQRFLYVNTLICKHSCMQAFVYTNTGVCKHSSMQNSCVQTFVYTNAGASKHLWTQSHVYANTGACTHSSMQNSCVQTFLYGNILESKLWYTKLKNRECTHIVWDCYNPILQQLTVTKSISIEYMVAAFNWIRVLISDYHKKAQTNQKTKSTKVNSSKLCICSLAVTHQSPDWMQGSQAGIGSMCTVIVVRSKSNT